MPTTPLTPKAHDALPRLTPDERTLLTAARHLIASPAQWAQGSLAKTASHQRTDPRSPDAVCWCAIGAVTAVCETRTAVAIRLTQRLDLVTETMFDDDRMYIRDVNDDLLHETALPALLVGLSPHERVLLIYDKALE